MKRTTLIAIAVGSILGTALPGAYAQQAPPGSQQPIPAPQVITPAAGKAGASAPQTSPSVAQAEPAGPLPTAQAAGQADSNSDADKGSDKSDVQRDKADMRADRKDIAQDRADVRADRKDQT